MICPKCAYEQPEGTSECPHCGVIFAKIHQAGESAAIIFPGIPGSEGGPPPAKTAGAISWLKDRLPTVAPEENRLFIAGRAIVYLVLIIWGWRIMSSTIQSNYAGESFMHLVNLPFHEAGHVFFSPFGRFLHVFGGTLGQWLVPFIVLCAFVVKGNPFGAVVGLWWFGESFMDIAPYMDDARAGQLMLLGGVTGSEVEDYHDWEVLLTKLGWLRYDHLIARISFGIGMAFMVLSLIWGGYIIYRQFRSSPCKGEPGLL
jgi:hypothetical protein